VGLAAVLGHIFPIFLKFQGGKAVATSFGVVAVLCPLAAINLFVVFAVTLYQVRIFSAASLLCAWLLPLAVGLFCDSKAYLFLAGILSGLVLCATGKICCAWPGGRAAHLRRSLRFG
jgi:acyl phosphate:glycerol-3-phosphate acyltransferase